MSRPNAHDREIEHVHIRVSQSVLHWHLTIFKESSGAGGKSVVRGSSRPRVWSHAHCPGSNLSDLPTRQLRRSHPERCRWKHFSLSRELCITIHILMIQFRETELGKSTLLESVQKLWEESGLAILRT